MRRRSTALHCNIRCASKELDFCMQCCESLVTVVVVHGIDLSCRRTL
jgi:hypothetical protein